MSVPAFLILVLVSIDPATGNMTIGTQPLPAVACAARLEELRAAKPRNAIGFCAEPGQAYTFKPNVGS